MLLTVVEVLGFGWGDAAGVVVVDAPAVEPVDPFQGGQLQVLEAAPGAAVAHELGLAGFAPDGILIGTLGTHGFSGGPVVALDPWSNNPAETAQVIGVVTNRLPDTVQPHTPSGLVYAPTMHCVTKLIEANPNGGPTQHPDHPDAEENQAQPE